MFCTNCGTEFEGNFCPNCGTKAGEQLPAQTVAPKETHEYYDKEGDLIDLSTIYGVYKDRTGMSAFFRKCTDYDSVTIGKALDYIEDNAPKVLFADSVATAKTSILIFDLAKIIKQNGVDMGGKRLFAWMRDNGYLVRRQGTDYNMPTQRSMELGLFEVKETSVTHADGHISVNKTPKVTGKGQQYFISKLLGERS